VTDADPFASLRPQQEAPSEPPAPTTTTAQPAEPAEGTEPPGRSGLRSGVEWILIIAGALAVALVIKALLIQAFYIPSESMVPTLKVGDRVLVNKTSYHLHKVHRGDIVVFKRPPGEDDPRIRDLIKRVIGLPGEVIEARDGKVYVNNQPLNEPYLPTGTVTANLPKQLVPPDSYFVMGDNRSNSRDSRVFHAIAKRLIVGRAFIRVWPVRKIGLL
jgi:signal peptidase I